MDVRIPLRKLRGLIGTFPTASPVAWLGGSVVLTALVASQATAQLQPPPTLGAPTNPAATPPATDSTVLPLSDEAKAKVVAEVKDLIAKSRKAIVDNQAPPAVKNYAQAMVVGSQLPELMPELTQVRDDLVKRGIKASQLDNAIRIQQSAMAVARNAPPANMQPTAAAAPGMLQPNSGNSGLIAPGPLPPYNPLRDEAASLAAQAKLALARGDLKTARQCIDRANGLNVADEAFAPGQLRPWQVQIDLERAEKSMAGVTPSSVPLDNAVKTASAQGSIADGVVAPSVFQPAKDKTSVAPASAERTTVMQPPGDESGESLFKLGLEALTANNREEAQRYFSQAWKYQDRMDPSIRSQLKDKLMLLQSNSPPQPMQIDGGEQVPALQDANNEQNLMRQKLFREVTGEIAEAERMVNVQPLEALDRLQALRQRTSQSTVDGVYRKQMLAMIDKVLNNVQNYVDTNRAEIDLVARNGQIQAQLAQDAANQSRIESEIHRMVTQYNDLMDKGMYAEAELVASKVYELAPDSEIHVVMTEKAKIKRNYEEAKRIQGLKADGFVDALNSAELAAAVPTNLDKSPMNFGPISEWENLGKLRSQAIGDATISPAERVIRERLKEPVTVKFKALPLAQAIESLSDMVGVVMLINNEGLETEGITSDVLVNLDLKGQDIPLKSVLNNILNPLKLTYVVQDDVLLITSNKAANYKRITKPYNVKDLVLPIPNFVNDYNTGLAGAIRSAYINHGQQLLVQTSAQSGAELAATRGQFASVDPNMSVLGQPNIPQVQMPGMNGGGMGGMPGMGGLGFGGMGWGNNNGPVTGSMPPGGPIINGTPNPGQFGGASQANFGPLIQLILSTIDGNWERDGGSDTIMPFQGILSLVVAASQETHEEIAALLNNLRAQQNLQVTIEVRFMTLSDTFFERIGVDFSFGVDNNADVIPPEDGGRSTVIGLSSLNPLTPTADLDVRFTQNSFETSVPTFGVPDRTAGGRFGLAILSDIELFFLLEAAQGDARTNVLQAPKVTMYDGQIANINDTANRPFVIGLTPVVGDFAVAQQPIIVVLNDGTNLNVQSVVSADKRFVRLTLTPMFTRIENADRTFTFSGSRTTRSGTTVLDPDGNPTDDRDDVEDTTVGSTVQLPTFATTFVSTTVTVPDGGTILLGGIKRLREGRTERGVPLLNKLPYISRLFKNVGIGRETNTLMFTVTPRIIIPEEEEQRVMGTAARP